MNRRFFVLASLAAACAPPAAPELTLDDVLRRHAAARGGAAALDAVANTLNVAEVVEPSFSVFGRYIASTQGLMRVDIFVDGARVFSEGIDIDGAWDWPSDLAAPRAASAQGAAALAHGVEFNLFGLHALAQRGHTLTLEGRETIAGIDYHKLKIRLADGFETWRYINPETWLIDRARDLRALHPDVDPTQVTIESEYTDYRPVAGVQSSFRWTQSNVSTGELMQTGTIQQLAYNVAAEALNFARSAAVIAP